MAQLRAEDYNLLKFTPDFWKKIMTNLAIRIKDDAKSGLMQDGKSNLSYRSRQYVRYKRTYMQGVTLNRKIKPYNARSVVSNQTGYVDMHLTGDMFEGLLSSPQADADGFGGTIGYLPRDAGKVFGNEVRGYVVLGVNEKNAKEVEEEILSEIDENIRSKFEKTITFNIG